MPKSSIAAFWVSPKPTSRRPPIWSFQMLEKFLGDRLAIIHAQLMARPAAEPLESLALGQQSKGQAVGEVVGR